jgi:hypothetical protein
VIESDKHTTQHSEDHETISGPEQTKASKAPLFKNDLFKKKVTPTEDTAKSN